MNIIKQGVIKNGIRRVTIDLDAAETLLVIERNSHYRLGDPHLDIVPGDRIINAVPVVWDDIGQSWID